MSGIASWKSAALLAIVAMVAAVAFSGVLTNTQNAEAQAVDFNPATANYEPGTTLNLTAQAGRVVSYAVNAVSTSSGTFANGETTISCSDANAGCDVGKDNATPPADVPDSIQVTFTIADDAADGFIVIVPTIVLAADGTFSNAAQAALVVNVMTQPKPDALTLTAASTSVDADGGSTAITVKVTDDQSPANEMAGQAVNLIATSGLFDCNGDGTPESQVCQVTTPADTDAGTDGVQSSISVNLYGVNREGTATITATHASPAVADKTVEVTFFGDAASLEATVLQSSIHSGGSTFVVLTVKDAAGSTVSGANPVAATEKAIVKPEAANSVGVYTAYNVAKPNTATAPANNSIPYCAVDGANPDTDGTNDAGQCVVQVTAHVQADTDDVDTADFDETSATSTRGVNTLNFALGTLTATTTVTVAGPASSITSDAPDSVEPLSTSTITVTVKDDADVLVGVTEGTVVKVAGEGIIGDGASARATLTTSNGVAKFTYTSGLAPDTAVFRVGFGDATPLVITITVGEAAADASGWNKPLASGTHNLVWNGADGADPADAGDGIVAIWQWTGSGWIGYFSDAGAVGLANNLTELNTGEAYWVVVE